MYAPWTRAIRSAALHAPNRPLARRQNRCFHASAQARAAPPSSPPPADDGNPNDGRDKPDKDDRDADAAREENIFGENGLNGSLDGQGRQKRRPNGSLRARTLRNRVPEELPPLQLPNDFRDKHVYRYGDVRENIERTAKGRRLDAVIQAAADLARRHVTDLVTRQPQGSDPKTEETHQKGVESAFERHLARDACADILEAAAWNTASVEEAHLHHLKDVRGWAQQPDGLSSISKRGEIFLAAAYYLVAHEARSVLKHDPERAATFLAHLYEHTSNPHAVDLLTLLWEYSARGGGETSRDILLERADVLRALHYVLYSDSPYMPILGLSHNDSLSEATSSIRSGLALSAPKSVKPTELKRSATILHFPYYQGFSWPQKVVKDIAAALKADVLHLTPYDIAHVVGSYLGQDTTRAPGSISLLGYKAAYHQGRIRQETGGEEELDPEGLRMPYLVVRQEGLRSKDSKKPMSFMDTLLGEPSGRGKSDDLWEDIKLNAALEELVHTADPSNATTQRPLIIHLHDFNAFGADLDGSMMLTKIRKIVDNSWSEGRKIVLVGSCSSLETPKSYMADLKRLESSEHVITFNTPRQRLWDAIDLAHLMRQDYIAENTTNIQIILETLLQPSHANELPLIDFSLQSVDDRFPAMLLSESVLPLPQIYRIAKAMIGLRPNQPESYDQSVLDEALSLITRIDQTNERISKNNIKDSKTGEGYVDAPKKSHKKQVVESSTRENANFGPYNEDHEGKMLSGLVNATDIRTTFQDVHVPKETIDSIKMLTQLALLRPEAFSYGVLATDRIPGCLLYGPPGTGKTLLAKAVAKESGANMIEISGASINDKFVGESEKKIRALFRLAKKKAPLVIFIDEADALLAARGQRNDHPARRETINQFLREWDGMDTMKAFIMVATNRPFDLDEAVLRRLPRKLLIDLPLEKDRDAILKIHLKGEQLDDSVSLEKIAKDTPMYSGSDLKNVCVSAAMAAVKEEMEAQENHSGPEPYKWAEKRILSRRHFDKALKEVSASVNEDMQSMTGIKKFDEKYGEGSSKRKKKRGMGFEVVPLATDANEARVRSVVRP